MAAFALPKHNPSSCSEFTLSARRVGEAIHAAPCSQALFGLSSSGPSPRRVPGRFAAAAVSRADQASLSETLSISRPCRRGCTSSLGISLSPIIHFPDRDTRGIISAPTVPPRSAGQKTLGPRDHLDRKRAACLASLFDRSHPHGGLSKRAVRVSSRHLPAPFPGRQAVGAFSKTTKCSAGSRECVRDPVISSGSECAFSRQERYY